MAKIVIRDEENDCEIQCYFNMKNNASILMQSTECHQDWLYLELDEDALEIFISSLKEIKSYMTDNS